MLFVAMILFAIMLCWELPRLRRDRLLVRAMHERGQTTEAMIADVKRNGGYGLRHFLLTLELKAGEEWQPARLLGHFADCPAERNERVDVLYLPEQPQTAALRYFDYERHYNRLVLRSWGWALFGEIFLLLVLFKIN